MVNGPSSSYLNEDQVLDLIHATCEGHDCIIVVPPFASVSRPALGPHVLQEMAALSGLSVRILYANLIFAAMAGVDEYELTCDKANRSLLLGERIFASAAHGLPPLGLAPGCSLPPDDIKVIEDSPQNPFSGEEALTPSLTMAGVTSMEVKALSFSDLIARGLAVCRCKVIGVTTNFEQTNAAIAILKTVRKRIPSAITLLGGANCEAAMAPAMLALAAGDADFVFSGESENVFPATLDKILRGELQAGQVIQGSPCTTLDEIPPPDYTSYFHQVQTLLPDVDLAQCWLTYESSRGCWWGQKHHCTFCGLNGEGMGFRQKSSGKVLEEVQNLLARHPTRKLAMADNIMPIPYHKSLIPHLSAANLGATIFYEQKSNLTLDQVRSLGKAGVTVIQPGIESLSTSLLKLMRKGVSAAQNIALLRYARITDVSLAWNLLAEFPGDSAQNYAEMLDLLPALRHLNPPSGLSPLSIDRFSPYFDQRETYGIMNLRPWPSYTDVFPAEADVPGLAYHFRADYESGSRRQPEVVDKLREEVDAWRNAWVETETRPLLAVSRLEEDAFVLMDTRDPATPRIKFLTREQAHATLASTSLSTPAAQWSIANRYALDLDGRSIPLAIASYELMSEMEARFSAPVRTFQISSAAAAESAPQLTHEIRLPLHICENAIT
jgi:ribosomal peptide maturation radical SAM protein 1